MQNGSCKDLKNPFKGPVKMRELLPFAVKRLAAAPGALRPKWLHSLSERGYRDGPWAVPIVLFLSRALALI